MATLLTCSETSQMWGKLWGYFHSISTAVKWEFLESNPCQKVIRLPMKSTPEMAYYNEDEIKQLFKLLDGEDLGFKTAVYMLVLGGFRWAELFGLYWDDIDFENQTVSIYKNLLNIKGQGVIEGKVKTTRSKRTVSLPQECFGLLKDYKRLQDERKSILGKAWKESPYVFKMVTGGCMKPDWLSKTWKTFLESNNMRSIRLHDLRHTCATYLLSIGTPIATVSRKLGHSDIYTTYNTYTHSLDKNDKEAVEKLAERLFR